MREIKIGRISFAWWPEWESGKPIGTWKYPYAMGLDIFWFQIVWFTT